MVFVYPATLVRITDADTLRLTLDLGFYIRRLDQPYRLSRVNAPEMNTEAGQEAKGWLEIFLQGKTLTAQTQKADNFGRFIAEVWCDGVNLSDALVAAGKAEYKAY